MIKPRKWGPLFALVSLFGLGGLATHYSKPPNGNEPAEIHCRDGIKAKFPVPGSSQVDNSGKEKRNWIEELDKPTDFLLVIFNGLLVLFTYCLYRATAGLFTETAGLRKAA